jgi:PKD repeat protein
MYAVFYHNESFDPLGKIILYKWDFGDRTTHITTDPDEIVYHKFFECGNFEVVLTVVDDSGLSDKDEVFVSVCRPPVANAGPDEYTYPGLPMAFDGSWSYDWPPGWLVYYFWDFGDGRTEGGRYLINPVLEDGYAEPGVYRVTLTVTDNDGLKDSDEMVVSVGDPACYPCSPPIAEAGPHQKVKEKETVYFDGSDSKDEDGYIVRYIWDFGDGTTGEGIFPTHVYEKAGEYSVKLTVVDDMGLRDSDYTLVKVNPIVEKPDLEVSEEDIEFSDEEPTEGDLIEINATVQNIGTKETYNVIIQFWDGEPFVGTQIGENQTIEEIDIEEKVVVRVKWNTTGLVGDHYIYVIIDPDNVIDELNETNNIAFRSITVKPKDEVPPFIELISPEDSSNITNATVEFNFISIDNVDELLSCNLILDGEVMKTWTESVINASKTTYYADVSYGKHYWNVSCWDDYENTNTSSTWSFSLIAFPIADANGPYEGYEGSPITFNASASYDPDGKIVLYEWDWDNDGVYDESTTSPTLNHTWCDDYSGIVGLRVTDDDGLKNTTNATVRVYNVPPIANAGPDQVVDVFDLVTFIGGVEDLGWCDYHTYAWDFGDGTNATGQNVTHTYNKVGNYTVTLTVVDDDTGSDTDTALVTVRKRLTWIFYTGDTSGQYSDSIILRANLTDKDNGLASKEVTFTLGTQSASATTDSYGVATASIALNQPSGNYTVIVEFSGDEWYLGSINSTDFEIEKEDTVLTYTGDLSVHFSDSVALSAKLSEIDDEVGDLSGKTISFKIGTQSASALTNEDGIAETSLILDQIPGSYAVETYFEGDDYYLPSQDSDPFELLKEDVVLSEPNGTVMYGEELTIRVTLLDDDGNTLLHQFDLPKVVILEFFDGTDWLYLAKDSLESVDNTDYVLELRFTCNGTVPPFDDGIHKIRARFDGDVYYNGAVSEGNLTILNRPPVADAGLDQVVDEGEEVQFDGSGSYDLDTNPTDEIPYLTYHWDFGDGTTGEGMMPTHVYCDNGVYTVTLTVTDDDFATDSDEMTVTVKNVAPIVDAGPDQTINEGSTASFSGNYTDPGFCDTHTYYWEFGEGTTISDTLIPSHTYGDNGIFTVTLYVADDDEGLASDSLIVTVENLPPEVEAGLDQVVTAGDNVSFEGFAIDKGSDDLNFTWNWSDGTPVAVSTYYNDGVGPDPYPSPGPIYPFNATDTQTHVYYSKGSYTVTLTVNDDDTGISIDTLLVTVNPIPATIDCDPETINLKSKAKWITCYIELPPAYNVSLIDINTVKLIYKGYEFQAVNDTKYDFVTDPEEYLTDEDQDGIVERMVKFYREELKPYLEPGDAEFTVEGKVYYNEGYADFEGFDTLRIIERGKPEKPGKPGKK